MRSRYHYSIFLLLGLLVIVVIFLSFKYSNNSTSSIPLTAEATGMDDTTNILPMQFTKDSWLGQIKESNQKSYFYTVSEIQLELN